MSAVPTQLLPHVFKPGNPGRVNGSQNKLTSYVRTVLAGAFHTIGGEEAFARWAAANPTEFYTRLWIRLLPDSSQLSDDEREKVLNAMLGVPQVLTQLYEGEVVEDAQIDSKTHDGQNVDTSTASPAPQGSTISPPDVPNVAP